MDYFYQFQVGIYILTYIIMNVQNKPKIDLREDLNKLQKDFLRSIKDVDTNKRIQLKQELAIALRGISLENEEKAKRAAELIIAQLEIKFLNEEKAKRAAELVIANIELVFQNNTSFSFRQP